MLLIDKMKNFKFSNNERIVVDYILKKEELIKDYSTKMIADDTYTSPSVLIRIAKKLNYSGWNDLKEDYLKEVSYFKSHFENIDANIPFNNNDTFTEITNKIGQLHMESIRDTLSLLSHDSLSKAATIMNQSQSVIAFAASHNVYAAQEFSFKLNRINKPSHTAYLVDDVYFDAARCSSQDCAVIISYSGETRVMLEVCKILKRNNVPIIAITSIGDSSLSKFAQAVLHITTREKEYSKIANYSSLASINMVLDVLYSCLFSQNYKTNMDFKISVSRQIESRNEISNKIILESNSEN